MNKLTQLTAIIVAVALLSSTAHAAVITNFGYTGSFQIYTVPAGVTDLIIEAAGAQGGGSRGGLGASLLGTFSVTPGETLNVLVGGQGFVTAQGTNYGAGGGGGTFIYRNVVDPLPLMAAGGGGGQSEHANGAAGSASLTPTVGGGTGSGLGGGGGDGAQGGIDIGDLSTAGGGAGWLTNGLDGLTIREPKGKGGLAPRNGALGGVFTHSISAFSLGTAGDGGFGGAGGMADNSGAGGGGGGFNGGGGGNNYTGIWGSGGGGGSFNSGIDQLNITGFQLGNGFVTITTVPEPSTLAMSGGFALGLAAYAWRRRRSATV